MDNSYDSLCFFFQAEDGIRDLTVTGVQTCALPIFTLTAPASGATVSGTVALTATASASSTYGLTVTSVAFLIDGTAVGTVTSSPYTRSEERRVGKECRSLGSADP